MSLIRKGPSFSGRVTKSKKTLESILLARESVEMIIGDYERVMYFKSLLAMQDVTVEIKEKPGILPGSKWTFSLNHNFDEKQIEMTCKMEGTGMCADNGQDPIFVTLEIEMVNQNWQARLWPSPSSLFKGSMKSVELKEFIKAGSVCSFHRQLFHYDPVKGTCPPTGVITKDDGSLEFHITIELFHMKVVSTVEENEAVENFCKVCALELPSKPALEDHLNACHAEKKSSSNLP